MRPELEGEWGGEGGKRKRSRKEVGDHYMNINAYMQVRLCHTTLHCMTHMYTCTWAMAVGNVVLIPYHIHTIPLPIPIPL